MDDQGEAEKRLARTATASPELAKIFAAAGAERRSSPRLVVLALASAAIGVLVVWAAFSWVSSRRAPHETAELDTADYLEPLKTGADPSTGEETAHFAGFAVSVESEPPGAIVTVAGVPRGEAPVIAGVDCRPGRRVAVRAEKAGFAPAKVATTCRKDTLVKLTVRLSP
jgi:hypothetical protein